MEEIRPATALITGSANGIGYELCKNFARDGYSLVLVDKDAGSLEQASAELSRLYPVQILSICKDLSQTDAPFEIVNQLGASQIQVDVLVNNAGFGTFGEFWNSDIERERNMLDTNVWAPVLLARLLVGPMVERGRGGIINIASMAAFSSAPYSSTYYASKAYLLSFSEGLRSSLQNSGVTVTTVCPGMTRTNFNWTGGPPLPRTRLHMTASDVAAIAYTGYTMKRPLVIPGTRNKLLALAAKLIPRTLATRLIFLSQHKHLIKTRHVS